MNMMCSRVKIDCVAGTQWEKEEGQVGDGSMPYFVESI